MLDILLKFLPVIVVVVLVLLLFFLGYLKAPPDTAYIISGLGKKRILIGRAGSVSYTHLTLPTTPYV